MDAKVPERGRRTQVGSGLLAGLDLPLQDARHPARPLGGSTWAAQPRQPAGRRESTATRAPGTCAPGAGGARRPSRPQSATQRPAERPAGRASAARPPHPPPPARSLSGCTRPSPSAPTTKWLPAASSRDPFVPFGRPNSAGPASEGPGSAGGPRGGLAGPRRPGGEAGGPRVKARPATGVGGGEKMAAILCGSALRRRRRQRRERGPAAGRTGELTRTDSSSFSIPVGICGTARFIEAYSCRSGRSSQRKTGSGFEASSARARNDSLLISGAADTSPLWGNGPGQRDHGEPGVRSPLAHRCRGLEGRSAEPAVRALRAAWRWEAETLRSSLARSPQYAMANMADIKTPLCALQPTPAIPHTASRSGAGTRGGGPRARGRAPARSARPANPRRPAPLPHARRLGPRPRGRGRTGRVWAARGALGRRGPRPASRPARPPSRARSRRRRWLTGEGAAKLQHPLGAAAAPGTCQRWRPGPG